MNSLDDEPNNILENGDFVWTVGPINNTASQGKSVMCFVHLTLFTEVGFERTHEKETYTSFECQAKLIKTIIKLGFV